MILTIIVYLALSVFLVGTVCWAVLVILGLLSSEPERVHGSDDVQARIVTVGTVDQTVRRTANEATNYFDDVHIVSEQQFPAPPGVNVHVVPDDYESTAHGKARALDWAAQAIPCDRKYVLYLDEDTIVTGFDGVPDRDIVQFLERTTKTGSRLSWYTEVFRMGFQQEMYGFRWLPYPLYLWGGGVAIRKSVEDDIGWDCDSITEDTLFLWRAMDDGYDYTVTSQRWTNQSPPNLSELVDQRKRWLSGSMSDISVLPVRWRFLVLARNGTWALSTATIGVIALGVLFVSIPLVFLVALTIGVVSWPIVGAVVYRGHVRWYRLLFVAVLGIVLYPIVHTLNGIGVISGLLRPADEFTVTEKR